MSYQRIRTPIGRRRERASLQRGTATSDGMGGQTITWATVAQPWVAVAPLDQRDYEALSGDQLTAKHGYHLDLRYRYGVVPEPTMRLLWRGKTLEIQTVVDDDATKRRLIALCGEVQ